MQFRVDITEEARSNIESAYGWILERDEDAAERWLEGLEKVIGSLQNAPRRCALAPESSSFDEPISRVPTGKQAACSVQGPGSLIRCVSRRQAALERKYDTIHLRTAMGKC